jgi:hypothetical protein
MMTNTNPITREYLHSRDVCDSDKEIAELVPPEGLTPLQVCDDERVPAEDRLWVLLHTDFLPERTMRLLACDWADRALSLVGSPDPRSVAALEVARRYARGETTREELDVASAAAWAVAWAASRDSESAAARAAAWAASRDSESDSESDALIAVASAAASAAASDAAASAMRGAQLADVRVALRVQLQVEAS